MSANEITGGDIMPAAQQQERIDGSVTYRKVFEKVSSAENLALSNAYVFLMKNTPADDYITIGAGTQTDTQGTMSVARWYGSGTCTASHGASSVTLVQDSTLTLFASGDVAVITDKTDIGTESGTIEYFTVDTVSQTQNTVTLQIDNGYTLKYDYAAGSVVASTLRSSVVGTSLLNKVVTSASGTFDGNGVLLDSVGTVYDTWTLTFTSATAFTVYGTATGLITSGSINTEYATDNTSFSGSPYFTIPVTCWGGSFQLGDTVSFTTTPAALPVWVRRTIPQNCQAYENNTFTLAITGDS
jgi:hypothetical protein